MSIGFLIFIEHISYFIWTFYRTLGVQRVQPWIIVDLNEAYSIHQFHNNKRLPS
ncbi:hypothetical protein HanIR_Chr16g0834111 [Helianthus annuus]|nr:hypothetical protein HanIR_Chr16g0834111 [Helianthus annuus]